MHYRILYYIVVMAGRHWCGNVKGMWSGSDGRKGSVGVSGLCCIMLFL